MTAGSGGAGLLAAAGVGCAGAAGGATLAQATSRAAAAKPKRRRARRLARAALLQCWLGIAPQRRRGAGLCCAADRSAGGLGRGLGRQRRRAARVLIAPPGAADKTGLRACSCCSARGPAPVVEGPSCSGSGLAGRQVALQAQLPGAGQRGAGRGPSGASSLSRRAASSAQGGRGAWGSWCRWTWLQALREGCCRASSAVRSGPLAAAARRARPAARPAGWGRGAHGADAARARVAAGLGGDNPPAGSARAGGGVVEATGCWGPNAAANTASGGRPSLHQRAHDRQRTLGREFPVVLKAEGTALGHAEVVESR